MKNKLGFYISQIRLEGSSKEPAIIILEKGCNIISGASDTGKSYLFECLNFMFGGKSEPKNINEGTGYTKLLLEIRTFKDDTAITLMRELNGKTIIKKLCPIDIFWDLQDDFEILSTQHSAGNDKTISALLLNLSGFQEEKQITKNERNEKRTLSFRDISHLMMVDEMNIITDNSPVMSGNFLTSTAEKSILSLVLTGDDSSELLQVEDIKKSKAKLNAQLDLISGMIFDLSEKLKSLKETKLNKNSISFEQKIEKLTNQFNTINEKLYTAVSSRKDIWSQIENNQAKIRTLDALISRFTLLKEHYEMDLSRLEFILDGKHYLGQLHSVKCDCPICGTILESKPDLTEDSDIYKAISAEKIKTEINLSDLNVTVNEMSAEKESILLNVHELNTTLSSLGKEIDLNLNPFKESLDAELKILAKQQKSNITIQSIKKQIDDLYEKQYEIEEEVKQKKKVAGSKAPISYTYFKNLTNEIEKILSDWNYIENETIGFNSNEAYDIEIGSKPRGSFGKGVRAILYSAFILGIMKYCIKVNLPHPRLLIIDSPLTPFKDRDSNNQEEIEQEVQNSFFDNLSLTPKDQQIIIFENKVPSALLNEKINHIHFSGRSDNGRQGFIPRSSV